MKKNINNNYIFLTGDINPLILDSTARRYFIPKIEVPTNADNKNKNQSKKLVISKKF